MRQTAKLYVLSALLLLPVPGCLRKAPPEAAAKQLEIPAGKLAPDFLLPDLLSGDEVRLSAYKGRVVLVDFWATWCPPCRMEIPGFINLQQTHPDNLQIIGVSVDQGGVDAIRTFAKAWKMNYKIVLDPGVLSKAYGGVDGIPATFLIGKDGRLLKHYEGFHDPQVFKKDVEEALKQG